MYVEGRLKQEKIQGCWFVDGKVPSIRMQITWEPFLISFKNNVIESAKQNKNLHSPLSCLKATSRIIKSNQI